MDELNAVLLFLRRLFCRHIYENIAYRPLTRFDQSPYSHDKTPGMKYGDIAYRKQCIKCGKVIISQPEEMYYSKDSKVGKWYPLAAERED